MLHMRGQLFVRPFVCHRLVLCALPVIQLLLNLTASYAVIGEVFS